jgi:hypothetical protein
MKKSQGNQWALLTKFEVNRDIVQDYDYLDYQHQFIQGAGEIRFSGIAPATPQILKAMKKWMYNGIPQFPIYADEWMCLYCGSPNPLPKTHCSQCAAPRNWLIG